MLGNVFGAAPAGAGDGLLQAAPGLGEHTDEVLASL